MDSRHLTLLSLPSGTFTLEIINEIHPEQNTSLEVKHAFWYPQVDFEVYVNLSCPCNKSNSLQGLFKSSGNFCTQCEAEGFRKITFYQVGILQHLFILVACNWKC